MRYLLFPLVALLIIMPVRSKKFQLKNEVSIHVTPLDNELERRPGPRALHSLIYNEQHKSVLLLDGYYPSIQPERSEIWSWNGKEWKCIDSIGPPPRYAAASVFDAARKRVVTYGGRVGKKEKIIGDVWEWDGSSWTAMIDSSSNARDHHSMVYDKLRKTILMFGGGVFPRKSGPWATDTWGWNGKAWKQIATKGPIGRVTPLVYDSKRSLTILFGGVGAALEQGAPQPNYNDTWGFDGNNWKQLSDNGPPPRDRHALAYDKIRDRIILYGGSVGQKVFDDMWEWNGKTWTEIKLQGDTPGQRCLHAMEYDVSRDRVILYGGNNGKTVVGDTWEWDGKQWLKIAD